MKRIGPPLPPVFYARDGREGRIVLADPLTFKPGDVAESQWNPHAIRLRNNVSGKVLARDLTHELLHHADPKAPEGFVKRLEPGLVRSLERNAGVWFWVIWRLGGRG